MDLPKAYIPKEVEEKWYAFWEEGGFFKPDLSAPKESYCIILPPPNVTGALHMGHALVDTLQDILIRRKRMQGFKTLWMPGTDHAGIATQTVVERHLIQTEGKRRRDYSRVEFLKHVWNFKEEKQNQILSQLRRLGCSLDWSRLRFTMDETSTKAVLANFKKMFDEGHIYRGDYLVNWDPATQTALADDEVEHEEKESSLWHFRYPIKGQNDFVVIATTRPETMLGDTAVAVSPKDPRFQALVGKELELPLTDRTIPIIEDHYVDPDFGSGCVKITPAHDPNDYEIGMRHNLEFINIMTPDGRINENGGTFEGLSMQEARKAVVDAMKKKDLIQKIEPHTLRVGVSYRSKAVIEPYLSKQWFIKMEPFKEKLMSAVKDKRTKIVPAHFEKTYFHWIENLRDWCISRQLWWGHRIPIWYNKDNPEKMICHIEKELPEEIAKNPDDWIQDEDVLDTWFSSALWPFSTLGWPEKTEDLTTFYPTSVLVTGHDILFFWVARMILMGEYVMDKVPFHESFIHGLIYGKSYWRESESGHAYVPPSEKREYDLGKSVPSDVFSKWEKMSKSKGNVIDPIEIIDEYGTDAMRMALTSSVTHARQIDLDRRRFEEFKNFANKMWNGARFIFMNLEGLTSVELSKGLDQDLLTLEDRWILSLLNRTIQSVNTQLDNYAFDKAATLSYEFFWKSFCAYYLELAKPTLFGKNGTPELKTNKQKILLITLMASVRLMHPLAPYITEELFSLIKERFEVKPSKADPYTGDLIDALNAPACIKAPYPAVLSDKDMDTEIEKTFTFMEEIVYSVRAVRGEMQIPPGEKTDLYISSENKEEIELVQKNQSILHALLKIEKIHFEKKDGFGASTVIGNLKLFVPLPDKLREKEKSRLEKEKEKLQKAIVGAETKLQNPQFSSRAPKEVIEKMRGSLKDAQNKLTDTLDRLSRL